MPVVRFRLKPKSHLILMKGNKILLLNEDGNYDIISGDTDGSESFNQIMIREAEKKLGIQIRSEDLEIVHVMHRLEFDGESIHFFVKADVWEGEPKIMEHDKYSDIKWFEIDNLPKNIIPYIKQAIGFAKNIHTFYSQVGDRDHFSKSHIHEIMLADRVRMDAYFRAIHKYVKKGDRVIDFGTGTGILSFFASLKKPDKIYAIDNSEIIEYAKLIAKKNDIKNIDFVRTEGKDFDIDQKVDVILQEHMGSRLFNEKMIENVVDLRKRLLKRNGKILPNRFELFIVPVRVKDEFNIPSIWEFKIRGIDFSCLEGKIRNSGETHRFILNHELDYFLCDPEKFCSFDLEKIKDNISLNSVHLKKRIRKSGRLDGFCMFFKAIFDDEISFTNSPLDKQTHWKVLLLGCKPKKFKKGDLIEFKLDFNDLADIKKWKWICKKIA